MNYHELANELNRSYNTVRKWRGQVTKISGYEFKRIKVKNGRGRKNRTVYDFSSDDLDCFLQMIELMNNGSNMHHAITSVWGNIHEKEKKKQTDKFKVQAREILMLKRQVKTLQTELDSLIKQASVQNEKLEERLQNLEQPKGMKKLFK